VFKSSKTKRSVQVSIVKTPQDDSAPEEGKYLHPDTVKLITERGKEVVKVLAIAVVGIYAAVKIIDTASEVVIKKTKSADNEEN
jgi:hypothetical protein